MKPDAKVIEAFNEKEAKQKFIDAITSELLSITSKGDTSEAFMEKVARDIKDINIKSYDSFEDKNENNMPMFGSKTSYKKIFCFR